MENNDLAVQRALGRIEGQNQAILTQLDNIGKWQVSHENKDAERFFKAGERMNIIAQTQALEKGKLIGYTAILVLIGKVLIDIAFAWIKGQFMGK
jgi:hypothetical protein